MKYEYGKINTKNAYRSRVGKSHRGTKLPNYEALIEASKNRRFEIELYWKRGTYFWTFVAATFTGFVFVDAERPFPDQPELLTTIAAIGMLFSLGWFLANKGSKFWQENWEEHINMLEDEVFGGLYKTVLDHTNPRFSRFKYNTAYHYSVSKINQALSQFIVVMWIYEFVRSLFNEFGWYEPCRHFNAYIVIGGTAIFMIILVFKTRGGKEWEKSKQDEGEFSFYKMDPK